MKSLRTLRIGEKALKELSDIETWRRIEGLGMTIEPKTAAGLGEAVTSVASGD